MSEDISRDLQSMSRAQPPLCLFDVCIEYQDPLEVLRVIDHNNNSLNNTPDSTTPLDGSHSVSSRNDSELIAQADTIIHTLQTFCDPSMAIPHLQDIVIADVVRTYGEAVERFVAPSSSSVSCEQSATRDGLVFCSALNTVVVTLFAKHASLGLCALSEVNLQLNSLGHLSAFNPDNHAELLQIRAETFCAYFHQKRYVPYKFIALISAGGGVPSTAPLHSPDSLDGENESVPCITTESEGATAGSEGRTSTNEVPATRCAKKTSGPNSTVAKKFLTLSRVDPDDGRDRRDSRKTSKQALSSGFSRFGRDLSSETFSRVSERTLSILGLGDIVNHRETLLSVCCGTSPLYARPASSEYSQTSPPPKASFRDERGVVIIPHDRKKSSYKNDLPEALSDLYQIHVHDPSRMSSSIESQHESIRNEYAYTTHLDTVLSDSEKADKQWAKRTVVALQVRPSLSGASVVIVEFSRKQEATDFRRFLAAFQKFGFLGVFKVQQARQLVSEPCQFFPPNEDPAERESIVYPEEVTIDSLLSASSSHPRSAALGSPAAASPSMSLGTCLETGSLVLYEGICDGLLSAKGVAVEDTEIGLRLFELLAASEVGGSSCPASPMMADFIPDPLSSHLTLSIPHLGGPRRKAGLPADDAVDFSNLHSFLLRMQSEVLGSAQIRNPAGLVSVLELLLEDATRSIGDAVKEATKKQSLLVPPTSDTPTLGYLNDFALAQKKALNTFEGCLLSVATHLVPLAVYTRTLLCDMGACHSRTLGRLNRGIIRQCISKATSLADGLITGALQSAQLDPNSMMCDDADSLSQQKPLLQEIGRTQSAVANTMLEAALLLSTVATQWDALFEKAAYYAGGANADRYTIRAYTDKQTMDTKPLQDQSLRLVQTTSAYLARCQNCKIRVGDAGGASEAELTRNLLLAVRRRSTYYSFYGNTRPHWPISIRWFSPPTAPHGTFLVADDYQSVSYVPFFRYDE